MVVIVIVSTLSLFLGCSLVLVVAGLGGALNPATSPDDIEHRDGHACVALDIYGAGHLSDTILDG